MEPKLKEIILRVINRYFDMQYRKGYLIEFYLMRFSRSNPELAKKQIDFAISELEKQQQRLSSEEIEEIHMEANFEKLFVSLLDDTNTLYQLNKSWTKRLKFLFTKSLK